MKKLYSELNEKSDSTKGERIDQTERPRKERCEANEDDKEMQVEMKKKIKREMGESQDTEDTKEEVR